MVPSVARGGASRCADRGSVKVVRAGRAAETVSSDGAVLRYRPEQQVLGMAAIVEVTWADEARGGRFGLVEVIPDASGELLVQAAERSEQQLLDE